MLSSFVAKELKLEPVNLSHFVDNDRMHRVIHGIYIMIFFFFFFWVETYTAKTWR